MTMVSLCLDDRYRTLQRLRDRLAEQIDVIESSRDLCALARRLQAVLTGA
jgi:transcription antitermination factor NusA-like protein